MNKTSLFIKFFAKLSLIINVLKQVLILSTYFIEESIKFEKVKLDYI